MPTVGEFSETLSEAPQRVDREAGIIHGLPYLGPSSPNTLSPRQTERVYSAQVRKACIGEANGKPCYLNHLEKGQRRGFLDSVGTWQNDRFDEKLDRMVADLHLVKSHKGFGVICDIAESNVHRKGRGPSISARGPYHTDGTKEVVEAYQISSIDLVIDPATLGGFFESKDKPTMTTLKELLQRLVGFSSTKSKAEKHLAALTESVGAIEVASAEGTPSEQLTAANEALILATYRDGALDHAGKLKRIGEILDPNAPPVAPVAAPLESKQILDRLAAMEASLNEERQQRLIDSVALTEGRDLSKASPALLAAMKSAKDRDTIKQLQEALPKTRAAHRSAVVLTEGKSAAEQNYIPEYRRVKAS